MAEVISHFLRSTPAIDALEEKLMQQLMELDRKYKVEAQPILDRLAELHALKIPVVTIIRE